MVSERKGYHIWRHAEAKTINGNIVKFESHPDDVEQVREALALTQGLHFPQTHSTEHYVEHGGYGRYTRYDVEKHDYAGGGGGYIEVLEIKDAPDDRVKFVVSEYNTGDGASFSEFDSLEHARVAFSVTWGSFRHSKDQLPRQTGFMRRVECGPLTPWFYAVGYEELVGDFALPQGLSDDSTFRLGQKCVVTDREGNSSIKTCMGTRYIEREGDLRYSGENTKYRYRVVYFDDGSFWKEGNFNERARPLKENELWISDAMRQFQEVLAGKKTEFKIEFADGKRFVSKFERKNAQWQAVEGRYTARLEFGDGTVNQGWFDFKPTLEFPTVQQLLEKKGVPVGKKLLRMEVTKGQTKPGGKKWSGVFYSSSE